MRVGLTAVLTGLLATGSVIQAQAAGTGDKKAAAPQQAEQTVAEEQAAHMGVWQTLWQNLLNTRVVPDDYTKTVKTGGTIERTYLSNGPHSTASQSLAAPKPMEKYEIYYPSDLTATKDTYPAVILVNGSGTPAKRYPAMFQHLASWGFIVIGNEDPGTGMGASADSTAAKLLALNQTPDSIFYHRIDTERIGISGHSQGGVGVFNAITSQPHHALYRTAVALSPTNERTADALHWTYDPRAVHTPILLLAGTKGDFELKVVLSKEDMASLYAKIPAPKAMARRRETEHAQTLYTADGYVTAWLCWQLQGDETAARAFTGEAPELLQNRQYQDGHVDGLD